ncbi:pantoate--beta-alanine ligase [Cloacibacterium sp. TD35]|uniref:pantoate--beta-alanine ligase n=1 Tax=Cloacibacterium sp. TD35 TaxID=2976818 RepID=UPI00237D7337|nr:pantoate--beta-alanine ligase [Cloacibacterium sp. TD35]WDT67000.1 pantoate--beta-alanine ligase [Cloacibacterium sp. TD35]
MKVLKSKKTLIDYIERQREMGKKIGFAPTMGALHEGHLSLYKAAKKENDEVISSIFVNPTQFNNPDDFQKYPKTLEKDLELLEKEGVDAVYVPNVEEMYPDGLSSKKYDFDGLENEMEGKYRPGHFDGVGTIVEELFRQVQPHNAYFGEKDYQQLAIIKKMVEKTRLPIKIHGIPTLREKDGLALSSRNMRLTETQRKEATIIYETLIKVKEWFRLIPLEEIKQRVQDIFKHSNFDLEYFVIADEETLKEANAIDENKEYRAFIVAYADIVRLIDNLHL